MVTEITRRETEEAVEKIKKDCKTTGPDDVPVEAWKERRNRNFVETDE